MAKSPFYRVLLESSNIDVTQYITSFDYEDCTDEDDYVTLRVDGAPFSVVDQNYFNIGQQLIFTFGFIGGKQSSKRHAVITEVDFDYDNSAVNIGVKARDLGFYAKKLTGQEVYKDMTASEIAKAVAQRLGLNADVQDTTPRYPQWSVAGKSYYQFLKEVANNEGCPAEDPNGVFEVYVRGNTLYFKQRSLSTPSTRTFKFNDGNGTISSVSISYEDSDNGSSSGVTSSGVDMETGDVFSTLLGAGDNGETATGGKRLDFDVNGQLKNSNSSLRNTIVNTYEAVTGMCFPVTANSQEECDNKAGALLKESAASIMTLTATLELDPTLEAGTLTTIPGLPQLHAGNWLVKKCKHRISASGGQTEIECSRNGSKNSPTTTGGEVGGSTNNTQGNTDGSVQKQIREFDPNGNRR